MRIDKKTLLITPLLALGWVALVVFGLRMLLNYESAPGPVGAVPETWPAISGVQLAKDRPTLVMLAHPYCPCTRASVNELARIMAQVQGKVTAYVLFLKPPGSSADWENTDLRRTVAAIPGVTVLTDLDGVEARRLGAETSGHTLLFDRGGNLLFSGGITQSRGHSGDNAGESAIVSFVSNHTAGRSKTVVFGCALAGRAQKGNWKQCLK